MLKKGDLAPNFILKDQDGNKHELNNYKGSWVLIYFYPKDNTPGCTTQACDIRDNHNKFEKLNVKVLGISTDSISSHEKFSTKYSLPFTILADENKVVVNKYGVWQEKKFMGKTFMGTVRTSFLINPSMEIEKVYDKVQAKKHIDLVMEDLQNFVK